jgi:hypothetical protein
MFPEEADLEAYESVMDATAEYMAASGDEVRGARAVEGGCVCVAVGVWRVFKLCCLMSRSSQPTLT